MPYPVALNELRNQHLFVSKAQVTIHDDKNFNANNRSQKVSHQTNVLIFSDIFFSLVNFGDTVFNFVPTSSNFLKRLRVVLDDRLITHFGDFVNIIFSLLLSL